MSPKSKFKATGNCYQAAAELLMDSQFLKNIDFKGTPYLVHAEVGGQGVLEGIRYGHAWVEDDIFVYDYSNGRQLVLPKNYYYHIGDVKTRDKKKYRKYSFEQARKKLLDTGNYGSWDIETDY
jgi:hypothetical protein